MEENRVKIKYELGQKAKDDYILFEKMERAKLKEEKMKKVVYHRLLALDEKSSF